MTNGIYILKLKDQCRTMYIFNIESLYFSYINFECEKEFVPTRLFEFFDNGKCENFKGAMRSALAIKRRCGEEIHIIRVNKTWGQVIAEAKILSKGEIDSINQNNDGRWDMEIFNLKRLERFY